MFYDPEVKAQAIINNKSVKVSGEVSALLDLNLADLDHLTQMQVTRKDKEGKNHIYSGVILSAILQNAGVPSGKYLHGKNLTKYFLIEAGDSYQVIFALAETDKDFTNRMIISADRSTKNHCRQRRALSGSLFRTKKAGKVYKDGNRYNNTIGKITYADVQVCAKLFTYSNKKCGPFIRCRFYKDRSL